MWRTMTRILLVDDDDQLRESLARMLTARGYQVETAANGLEAMRSATRRGPDLVVIDLVMPEKEGLETIRELVQLPKPPPIIAMSGGVGKLAVDVLPVARRLGARETLHKPFGATDLIDAVQRVLK
jgi:CheY-like chemotaxis protein